MDLLQHSNSQAIKLFINVPLQGSRVSLGLSGVTGPNYRISDPGSHLGGSGSHFSGMPVTFYM